MNPEEIQEHINSLSKTIDSGLADANTYYDRGRLYMKLGLHGRAISDFDAAVALDPESPAKVAAGMARSILDFYNKDLYNP